jgi:hypothetical protein
VTTTSGTPDQPDLPDTPGPDATPEQEAFVSALLSGLRADDPAMPEHVVARLEAALAEERRAAAAAGAPALGTSALGEPAAGGAEDPDEATTPGLAPVTVLPQQPQQRRRPDRSTRALQWLVGAAAAVLVVGGVGAVVRGTFSTSSDSAATAAGGQLLASGTAYSKDTLAEQARALVAEPTSVSTDGEAAAPELAPGTDGRDTSAEPGTASNGLDLPGCLQQLTGTTGTDPLAVDRATYEGRAAVVIVLASTDAPGSLDVWVVAPTCRLGDDAFVEFQRVAAP